MYFITLWHVFYYISGMNIPAKAKAEFRRLIRNAKTKDAALSAFDRNHYAGKYGVVNGELATAIAEHFRAIRDERFKRRHKIDLMKITTPTEIEFKVIEDAVRKCETILHECTRPFDVLAALLLVTGRRTAEVVGKTEFTQKWFRGTLKRGSVEMGRANYLVPFRYIKWGLLCLANAGLAGLTPAEANKRCAVPLLRCVPTLFPFVKKAHDLRAVHVSYLKYIHENKAKVKSMTDKERAEYLGTIINDQLAHQNVLSALPYLKFKIR